MKKLSIIMVISILLTMTYSCSDEFLEKAPLGKTSENVFYDATGIDALLIGTYAMVGGSSLWDISWGASIQNWTYGSVASDDAYKGSEEGDQTPVNDIERWAVQSTNGYPSNKWKLCLGMGVDRANKTLNVINITEEAGTITAEEANEFRGEARFLRALFNFEAWLVFGDYIPILTEETEDAALVSNVNASGAVLAFITDDLKFAADNLPASQSQVGRPTLYAAKALAARAYLQELDYASAKPLLDAVIAGPFTLAGDFMDNFNIATNNNSESIFEIQANVNDINESLNAEMGIGLNWPHGADIGMCCGFHCPSQNLVNAYKVDENGWPMFDTFNDTDLANDAGILSEEEFTPFTDAVDPRLDHTVSRRGIPYKDWGVNRGSNWVRKQTDGGPYLPVAKPFLKQAERYTLSTTTGWQTGINANNYRYLRLTHVYLWRAEVAAAEGDLATAKEYVNLIRNRAKNSEPVMGKCLATELPAGFYPYGEGTTEADYMVGGQMDWTVPAANYKIEPYVAFADANEAMTAVQWEQRLEFATEGFRFFDLRRWDNLPNKIGGKSMAEVLNGFAAADARVRPVFLSGATFGDNDKYQPIPQDQLDVQVDVLEQRPEYK